MENHWYLLVYDVFIFLLTKLGFYKFSNSEKLLIKTIKIENYHN